MDLALIGNCTYQALIDHRATVCWLCWPRFDASFVFGALLDEERGGEMTTAPADDEGFVHRQSYLGLTNILRTEFTTAEGAAFEVIDFAPRFRRHERYFKPTMLVRIIRPLAGSPRIRVTCRPTVDHGRRVPTRHIASNHIAWHVPEGLRLTTDIPQTYIDEGRPFLLEGERHLVLTWGEPLEAPLVDTCRSFLDLTRDYWTRWVQHTALPGCFEREVIRSALVLKLHQFEDTGAITAAATTSLPEYWGAGRNWDYRYCWLRDAFFTLSAMRRLNHYEETEAFVGYLANLAAAAPGEPLQPVYGIAGEATLTEEILDHLAGYRGERPVRVGNAAYAQVQHDVYGEMVAVLAPMFLDVRFEHLRSATHEDLVRRLLDYIERYLESPDAGLWEIRDTPKVHTFSLLMHQFGARMAARIGVAINDAALTKRAAAIADRAEHLIATRCWREAGYFADATSTDHADAALMMMVNLGVLDPSSERAATHVDILSARLRAGRGLLHRYVHHDGIGETHAAFTVCGFWHAEALARLGRKGEARDAIAALLRHQNHVGLFSEDVDPKDGTQLGNFPQTYSHVGLINAAFAIAPLSLRLD
ncbi:MAG: glycoside hydrolase family 15 protein [Myxococcota bacterium]